MRGEVETLQIEGRVSAQTGFPGGHVFSYSVESSPASAELEASFGDDVLTVRIPEDSVLAWATSEQVSIEAELLLDDGEILRLLVEKDFACLAPREGEDEADMYPHPAAGEGEC
jgi:hypothetical protein